MTTPIDSAVRTIPSEIHVLPGVKRRIAVDFQGAPASPVAYVYDLTQGGLDVTATIMPSGTHKVSGNRVLFKQMRDWMPNHTYAAVWEAVVGGNTEQYKTIFIVGKGPST